MDPIQNPFSPGAGSPPPDLVGRDDILDQAKIVLKRVALGRPDRSIVLTGLRGVGKTVLLNEIERHAESEGYRTVFIEALEAKPLEALLVPKLRKLLYELDRIARVGNRVKRALAVLKSFCTLRVTIGDIGLEIAPEKGVADSGDIENDLPELLVVVAEAAHERGVMLALLIDEVQYFSREELSSLIMTMHKVQQKRLPLVLIGAGLPILPGLAGDSKSYAERLFRFPEVGVLSTPFAAQALTRPVESEGVWFEPDAVDYIVAQTQGYPYFLQEWGYQSWNDAVGPNIPLELVQQSTIRVIQRLDQSFFRVRFDRLTPAEKRFLRAMAELGPEGHYRISDVVAMLDTAISRIGPTRASLIKKGMAYSPAHGDIAFTVPLFSDFMHRAIPDFVSRLEGV